MAAGSVLLVDEAYIHLSDEADVLDMVAAGKDLMVLRTFSKIYGMAGIRCGVALGRPDLLARLQGLRRQRDAHHRPGGGDGRSAFGRLRSSRQKRVDFPVLIAWRRPTDDDAAFREIVSHGGG